MLQRFFILLMTMAAAPAMGENTKLWDVYNNVLKKAKYVDLTHAFNPTISVWPGFGQAKFKPSVAGKKYDGYCEIGEAFDYKNMDLSPHPMNWSQTSTAPS